MCQVVQYNILCVCGVHVRACMCVVGSYASIPSAFVSTVIKIAAKI